MTKVIEALRLAQETVDFDHAVQPGFRPALLLDDTFRLLAHRQEAFRVRRQIKYRVGEALGNRNE